jgi:hypothetical protein
MSQPNFKRMMKLIDETFATRSDPDQLQVTQAQLKKLEQIHPSTLSELSNEDGPLIWVLIIPTTDEVRDDFISGRIGESELLARTRAGDKYTSLYLCSATTLPEARGKGKTRNLCKKAISEMMKDHAITSLFVWPFSKEGLGLSESLAREFKMPLLKRS